MEKPCYRRKTPLVVGDTRTQRAKPLHQIDTFCGELERGLFKGMLIYEVNLINQSIRLPGLNTFKRFNLISFTNDHYVLIAKGAMSRVLFANTLAVIFYKLHFLL